MCGCGGPGVPGEGRSSKGALSPQPACPAAQQLCQCPWRAHGRSALGPERKRDRRGHGACLKRPRAYEGRSARGHERVGAPARAQLRPGLQPARGAFLLRGLVRPMGWEGWAVSAHSPPGASPLGGIRARARYALVRVLFCVIGCARPSLRLVVWPCPDSRGECTKSGLRRPLFSSGRRGECAQPPGAFPIGRNPSARRMH